MMRDSGLKMKALDKSKNSNIINERKSIISCHLKRSVCALRW